MKPSIGRIVHYVLDGDHHQAVGSHRPAIIVREPWTPEMLNLQVFTDGENDGPRNVSGIVWRTSVHQDEETKAPGTWHWPERED